MSEQNSISRSKIKLKTPNESNHEGESLNLEMALGKVGGFGLFQIILNICMPLVRNSGSAMIYVFAFLVLP